MVWSRLELTLKTQNHMVGPDYPEGQGTKVDPQGPPDSHSEQEPTEVTDVRDPGTNLRGREMGGTERPVVEDK